MILEQEQLSMPPGRIGAETLVNTEISRFHDIYARYPTHVFLSAGLFKAYREARALIREGGLSEVTWCRHHRLGGYVIICKDTHAAVDVRVWRLFHNPDQPEP